MIQTTLSEKGVPTNSDGALDRTDSDAYSHAFYIMEKCPKGHKILEIRNGSDDVSFWYYKTEKELVHKFTSAQHHNQYEGDDEDGDFEEEEGDED
jgi:hypothetical protein